ncbi:MAG: type I-C CRISPR-associated endonuclease Cas1c [Thermotogae bacterium]|jgi:CRISPR-associated protein Cas1|nr:type I-C CRISPR-associated endonuclease Cas1c [Thermotogota bacterium]
MKRILNTLFVNTQKIYLKKEGNTVVATLDKKIILQLPLINISNIVCFGNIRVSPMLLGNCAKMGVGVSFLTESGRFLAKVQGPTAGNVLLRRVQYKLADDPAKSTEIVRNIVTAKIANSRTVLQRTLRDHPEKVDEMNLKEAIEKLGRNIIMVQKATNVDSIRGIEGSSAQVYFNVFNDLIVSQKNDFVFKERSRRPPLDKVNAMLSFVYTLLYNDIRSSLETVGLDPAVGFLHTDRPGRMSLALDMMEEFRPYFADRLVLSMINLKEIVSNDFKMLDNGVYLMKDNARKSVIASYQKRKQDEIYHPFVNQKMHLGLVFYIQSLLMARYIRGDIDGYPPFVWR